MHVACVIIMRLAHVSYEMKLAQHAQCHVVCVIMRLARHVRTCCMCCMKWLLMHGLMMIYM